jgi:hypothetical protein
MEIKPHKSYASYFWQSLIICILVFAVGIYLGYAFEANRSSKIVDLYQQSELELMDIQIQNNILSMKDFSCSSYSDEIINFADRVYNESKILDRFETANEFTTDIELQHKKYDLLRTLLWTQAIEMKKKCNSSVDIVLYFYEYASDDLDLKSQQNIFSKKLSEVKQEVGNSIILVPMAGNLNLTSIDIIKRNYNITILPTILINDKIKIDNIDNLAKLSDYLK